MIVLCRVGLGAPSTGARREETPVGTVTFPVAGRCSGGADPSVGFFMGV